MNSKDLQHFKGKLEKEKALLEEELKSVARKNPDNPAEWQATSNDMEIDTADENEVADKMEELEENTSIMRQLKTQYTEVTDALRRIKDGTYGTCEISGEPIEHERLEANPAARTSLKHMRETK